MVLPAFLRKTGTSENDTESSTKEYYHVDLPDFPGTDTFSNKPTTSSEKPTSRGRDKCGSKCVTLVVIVVLALTALTFGVMAFVHKALHGVEKSEGCELFSDSYVHKGNITHENGTELVRIECDDGYKLIGSQVIECLPSGHWNETPTCVPIECKNLHIPVHADVKLNKMASSIVRAFEVSCQDGYILNGNKTVVCQNDETWSPVPECQPVDCGAPSSVDNAEIQDFVNTTFNNTFLVKCKEGYFLENGTETVKCEASGEWSEIPVCAPVPCGIPNTPDHASILKIEGTVFGKSVEFKCVAGFEMKTSPIITCQSNARWSPLPECGLVNCGHPEQVANGRINNLRQTTYNSAFVVDCEHGYVLNGNAEVKCKANGRWSPHPVCDAVSCGNPDIPYHAHISDFGGTTYRKSVTFECDYRYRLRGARTATCQSNGQWTAYPSCEYISDPCYSNPCYSGHCVTSGNSYTCTSGHSSGGRSSSGFTIHQENIFKTFSLLLLCFLVGKIFI